MIDLTQLTALALTALTIAVLLVLVRRKKHTETHLSPLIGLASVFSIISLLMDGNRWLGFGMIGFGIIIAVTNAIKKNEEI